MFILSNSDIINYMKTYLLAALFILTPIVSVTALAQDVADIDPQGDSSCLEIRNNLRYRSTDAQTDNEVSALQDFLQSTGYLNANPSGFFGIQTRTATTKFQRNNGISATGYVGPSTRAKIKALSCSSTPTAPAVTPTVITPTMPTPGLTTTAPTPTSMPTLTESRLLQINLEFGATGSEVLKLQNFLKSKGYMSAAATGIFDEDTRRALIAYQMANNLVPTSGVLGPLTRALINAQMNVPTVVTPPTISTPTPIPVPVNAESTLNAYNISLQAGDSDISLARINLQVSLYDANNTMINPATLIKSFILKDGANIVATIPINTSSFTYYSGAYYVQFAGMNFSVSKNSRKTLSVDVVTAGVVEPAKYKARFEIYGSTGIRLVDNMGINIYKGATEASEGYFSSTISTLRPVTTYITMSTAPVVVTPPVIIPAVVPTTIVPITLPPVQDTPTPPNTSCPQSLTVGTNTFTLGECTLNLTMTDGAGNKDFNIRVIPSDVNKSFGFSVYGYGEGLPTYGSLGTASGGAHGITNIPRYLNDSYLAADGNNPKVYTGYFKIHIYEGSESGDTNFLYQNFRVTVNPRAQ
ncbi:MAG: hypothetical protein RJB39_422 [Candidatus Parcubacteria bacterium]